MFGFVFARLLWNASSNLKVRRSYNALHGDLMLLSASTLTNIWRREYSQTVAAIKKQLLSRNKVSVALDGWTSTNQLARTSIIMYYMDHIWALREVQLMFDEVDYHFFSYYKS